MVFNCQMCGAPLDVSEEQIVKCEYCGSKQALPKLSDDKMKVLHDRAVFYRRENDFDQAIGLFERILENDNTDPETYWSILLCRYGVEYVKDPISGNRIPTIHRVSFKSILEDEDFKKALELSSPDQHEYFMEQAENLHEIQNAILKKTANEKPYDVFICFKDTDESGNSTRDSLLATDIYHQLVEKKYKVFFSRISLAEHAGENYEPYIFSALNSAKVMIVLCTNNNYINSVWVKNEWKRFMEMAESDRTKVLIPVCKDIKPEELPAEFKSGHIQCLDMNKIDFINTLVKNIESRVDKKQKQSVPIYYNTTGSLDSLKETDINRAETFMKLCRYESARNEYSKISQKYPDDYRGWWGLIVSLTEEFYKTLDYRIVSSDLNKYFQYVKSLIENRNDNYKKLEDTYASYIAKCSAEWARNDVERVQREYEQSLNNQINNGKNRIDVLKRENERINDTNKQNMSQMRSDYEKKAFDDSNRGMVIIMIASAVIGTIIAFGVIVNKNGGLSDNGIIAFLEIIIFGLIALFPGGIGGVLVGGVIGFLYDIIFTVKTEKKNNKIFEQIADNQDNDSRIINNNNEIQVINARNASIYVRMRDENKNAIKEDLFHVLTSLYYTLIMRMIGRANKTEEVIAEKIEKVYDYYQESSYDIFKNLDRDVKELSMSLINEK